jgi:hypothetical protein
MLLALFTNLFRGPNLLILLLIAVIVFILRGRDTTNSSQQ